MLTREQLIARIDAAQPRVGRRNTGPVFDEHAIRRRGDHDLGGPDLRVDGPLVPAAVLVPLVERDGRFNVLLTQRASHLRDHAGQISFPGGRIEADDVSPEDAALREAEEEIGLAAHCVELVGRLDIYETRTGFEVIPVVGLVRPSTLVLDHTEVDEAFEVPLSFVLDAENHERHSRELFGKLRHFYVLPYQDRYIWGATAGMLVNLYEVLCERGGDAG